LFVGGLILGVIIFLSLKALWIAFLYFIFLISLLIHDLVQIWIAKRYGLVLKKFVIYPVGTKKMYGEDFEKPSHEFLYAFAGLMVYFLIFILTYIITINLFPQYWPESITLQNTITAQTFDIILLNYPLFSIFWVNFLLFIFNLFVFAVPLDGGKLLKALLTLIFGQYSANKFVPIISKIVAGIIVVVGFIFWDILIIIIGVFVYFVSSKESKENEILMLLSDKSVNEFVKPVELIFDESQTVLDCFEKMKDKLIPEALVKMDDNKYGVIDADKISGISKGFWGAKTAGDVAEHVVPATDKEKLGFLAQYMVEKNLSILPVVHNRTKVLIGIIRRTDLADFLKIHKIMN
jgi:stage IV sporulation protein FB